MFMQISFNLIGMSVENKKCLSVFFTAGYPEKNNIESTILFLQNSGVGMIEIGIPYSDPVADGPIIQNSSEQALKNGINLQLVFDQLQSMKHDIKIPILLMGYFNSFYKYGFEKFLKNCKVNGINTVIIPDLSPEIYLREYESLFNQYTISPVFIITPETSDDRIRMIDKVSSRFIYVLSSSTTTGTINASFFENENYFSRINSMKLKNKLMLGFGISGPKELKLAYTYFDGAIIGSAFIQAQTKNNEIQFINELIA